MMTNEDNETMMMILDRMHTAMEEIALFWGHLAEFNISQSKPGNHSNWGQLSRVKLWKTMSDNAIRLEWKPRHMTETQMSSIIHRRSQDKIQHEKMRMLEELEEEWAEEEVSRLLRRVKASKERRERHNKTR